MWVSTSNHQLTENWTISTITRAGKVLLLNLGHQEAPQVHGRQAEGELPDGAPLPQPVGEPGQVAVAVQDVGMKPPTKDRTTRKLRVVSQREDTSQTNQMHIWLFTTFYIPSPQVIG